MTPPILHGKLPVDPRLQIVLKTMLAGMILAALAACGSTGSTSPLQAPAAIRGTVRGGDTPVEGAEVQLYAAGTTGLRAGAIALLKNPVQADANGQFSVPASYVCPSDSSQLYVVARSGKPGLPSGVNNSSIALAALLGPCGSPSPGPIVVNEVTTIGFVWPMAGYMKSAAEIGSPAGDAGFSAAAASVAQYINTQQGSSPGSITANSFFTQAPKLYSLANLLDRCVRSAGGVAGDGSPCGSLFSIAASADGPAPADTMAAALGIAQNPNSEVSEIYSMTQTSSAFTPALAVAPADWTLQLSHPVATQVISLPTGTYSGPQTVAITDATADSKIYYTTDGTVPTAASAVYSEPVTIPNTQTLQAVAVIGVSQSAIASSVLTIASAPESPVAARLAILQQPSNATAGAVLSPAITVAVEDSSGSVIPTAVNPVTATLAAGTGLTGTLTVTPVQGIATFSNLVLATAGTGLALTLSSPGLTTVNSAPFTISPAHQTVGITLTPATSSVALGGTQQFNATVTGTSNTAFTWALSGTDCTGSTCGSISSAGLYTGPVTAPPSATVTITVLSVADNSKSASSSITLTPPQAAGYGLAWEDTFSPLNLCTTDVAGCNWYNPGIYQWAAGGTVTNPSTSSLDLQWSPAVTGGNFPNVSTASPGGQHSRAWTFGYFEVRMAFNPATGSWPGIWMAPTQTIGDPSNNGAELDNFEWQSNTPATFYGTLHVWQNGVDRTYDNQNAFPVPAGTDFSAFHTYGVLWTRTSVAWYFDNRQVGSFDTTQSPYNSVFAGQQSLYLILGQQSGCNWKYSQCSGQVSPLDMKVDWVHVYAPPSN